MKINLKGGHSSLTWKILGELNDVYVPLFLKDYDIDGWSYKNDVSRNHNLRVPFCEWLTQKEVLKIKSWELRKDNGDVIGTGYDIDELSLPMFLLKIEDKKHA